MLSAVSTFCASFIKLMQNEAIMDHGNWHAVVYDIPVKSIPLFADAKFTEKISMNRDVGYAKLEKSKNNNKPYILIRQFDESSFQTFPMELTAGRMPQNEDEIVFSEYLQQNGGVKYEIGDTITLQIGKRTNADGHTKNQYLSYDPENESFISEYSHTYKVVGIIKRPGFEYSWSSSYMAVSFLDMRAAKPDDMLNINLLVKRPNHGLYKEVETLAESAGIKKSAVDFNKELLRYSGVTAGDNTQNMIYGFAAVLVIIIITASVSLIYNAFAISVSERISQLGMLASVGATRRQKRRAIYLEGLLLGLIGIPAGIFTGIAGIGVTLSLIHPLLESFLNFNSANGLPLHVSPMSIAAAFVLASLTIFISVYIPARRASKIMPIDAIRQSEEIRLTRKAVKTSRLTQSLFGFEGEIALKNLKRSRKKYRATVISLVISLVLFLTVSYYIDTMQHFSSVLESGINFDLSISYTNTPRSETAQLNENIAALDEVDEAVSLEISSDGIFLTESTQLSELVKKIYSPNGERFSPQVDLYCLDNASFDRYVKSLGAVPNEYHDPLNPKIIIINYGYGIWNEKRVSGEILSVKPGDTLRFTDTGNFASGDVTLFKTGILTDKRPLGVGLSSFSNITAIVSREVLNSLPDNLKGIDSNGNPRYQLLCLVTDHADTLETEIQELVGGVSGRASVYNVAAQSRQERNLMLVISIFIYGFIILISLICIANILNTVNTNVTLRRREFAMLRSVGMTPESFNKMIYFESLFYGLKALLYGIPISVAVLLLLYKLQSDVFESGFFLPWTAYIVAVVLIFIIVSVTMLYSSVKIKKENIIDALKTEIL